MKHHWTNCLLPKCHLALRYYHFQNYNIPYDNYIHCRGQLSSLYFKDEADKEFICSTEDSSGMHKCNALPPFVTEDGVECMASLEAGLQNETDCINWNLYYTDCKPGEVNPFSGAISFDNIGLAWVAIFLVSWTFIFFTISFFLII